MCLLGQRLEVRGANSILEFLHVGIVDLQAELVQFALDVLEDSPLELLALGEDLFHRHAGNKNPGLALYHTLDDVLEVVLALLLLVVLRKQHGVLGQGVPTVLVVYVVDNR